MNLKVNETGEDLNNDSSDEIIEIEGRNETDAEETEEELFEEYI